MEMKINKNIYLKLIAVLLCIYIAISPFCQPKKVYANPVLLGGIAITLIAGMIAAGYARDAVVPAERLNELNEQSTANLQSAFPDPDEYNKQLGILENLSNDLLSGKDIDWSKYSGKAIYAISKAMIDILYPNNKTEEQITLEDGHSLYMTFADGYYITVIANKIYNGPQHKIPGPIMSYSVENLSGVNYYKFKLNETPKSHFYYDPDWNMNRFQPYSYNIYLYDESGKRGALRSVLGFKDYDDGSPYTIRDCFYSESLEQGKVPDQPWLDHFLSINALYRTSLKTQLPNKLKLPNRLPPSVINNYNTYINGESENLVIDPTDDELPQLPDNYNPVTDDPPDLDGYQDVTPDQEPTDTPDPTPSPTPEPTPSPDYDGSSWIKPIGDFFAGLLSFLKDALIPTQTVDFSPLQNMSTDFGSKFPFSLPGDIGKLFGVLQAEPRRPEFHMIFDLSKVGVPGEPIVWDLNFEQWDDAAAIVKTALYIGFLIGLVFISKNFMKN